MEENLPINFPNQIVPIFSKLGCNGGGCHGKSGGQNGFALSLLGFVPELDYQTLVKENRGRRLFPASPDNSLLLLKATGTMAHAGGKRMETDSDEYKLIRRWIASGTPFGRPEDPIVTKISVYPEQSIVSRFNRQQFSVYAHYSDGTVNDVTAAGPVRKQRHRHRRGRQRRPGPLPRHVRRSGHHGPLSRPGRPPSAPPCRSA